MSGGGGGGSSSSSMRTAAAAGRCTRGADAAVVVITSVAVRTTRRRGHRRRRRGEGCHQRSTAGRCSSRWEATLDWVRSAAVCYLLMPNKDIRDPSSAEPGLNGEDRNFLAWPERMNRILANRTRGGGGEGGARQRECRLFGGVGAQRRPGSNRLRSGGFRQIRQPSKAREQRERSEST